MKKLRDRPAPGTKLMAILEQTYLTPGQMQKMGALIVSCALFENNFERALWRLGGQPKRDALPWTEILSAEKRIKKMRSLSARVGDERWMRVVTSFCDAAENVRVIRNTLAHGEIGPGKEIASMILNGLWDCKRSRGSHILHVGEQQLNLVLEGVGELLSAVIAMVHDSDEPYENPRVLGRADQLSLARSYTGEIRHLTELMNSEKY